MKPITTPTKVLIIEDEKVLAEMYKDIFQQSGFEVTIAFSGEEAMTTLKKQKPDFILLDIVLPKENGIHFLKKFREEYLSKIPIVVFSNYDEPETKKEAFRLGVNAYLLKARYTPKELIGEVKKILKGKRS